MNWFIFPWFFSAIAFCWLLAIGMPYILKMKPSKHIDVILSYAGLGFLALFIALLWVSLSRPPLRTLGETRLWYSFFLATAGIIIYLRWKYLWIRNFAFVVALLFLLINLLYPETHNRDLMPALRSFWFIPHVVVYLLSYGIFAATAIIAVRSIIQCRNRQSWLLLTDNLVTIAFCFLTLGLIFGSIWAKKAWGHYWTWDPKETWALLTWLVYVLYMHFRKNNPSMHLTALWLLAAGFFILLLCWFGLGFLPSASQSIHIYS